MQNPPRMTGRDWAMLVLLSVLWGGSFFFAKIIVQQVPPLTLVFVRFAAAAGALWVYLAVSRTPVPGSLSMWTAFAGMGALNNLVPVALISWAQITIPSGWPPF
jgi:drug/metabolite transporter (DMT)-like permease